MQAGFIYYGDINMNEPITVNTSENKSDISLLKILDRGIDDMEAGREVPLEDAFQEIAQLRERRRVART